MSTDTDTGTDRGAGLFDYVATMTPTGFTVQFPIGYVIEHDSAGPATCVSLSFCGEYLGDFRFLTDLSPAALAEELRAWLAAAGTDEEVKGAGDRYVPGMLHISDNGEADDWARACTTLILQGPTYA
jgi:hypothetical protein